MGVSAKVVMFDGTGGLGMNLNDLKSGLGQVDVSSFSMNFVHSKVVLEIPSWCNRDGVEASGRGTQISIGFAAQGIMALKAALMGDYSRFDQILKSRTGNSARALGRQVTPWNQQLWDSRICAIAREIMIAKVKGVPKHAAALLSTGDALIAEASGPDNLWGIGLHASHPSATTPSRWRGTNILGWALMEARTALKPAPQQPPPSPVFDLTSPPSTSKKTFSKNSSSITNFFSPASSASSSASSASSASASSSSSSSNFASSTSASTPSPTNSKPLKRQRLLHGPSTQTTKPIYDVDGLASLHRFGPNCFTPLPISAAPQNNTDASAFNLSNTQINQMVLKSVPDASSMKGERGRRRVTDMLSSISQSGLFMHGPPQSPVNAQVIPAIRLIFTKMADLNDNDPKRVEAFTSLAQACQDCQQVQARVILKIYSQITAQETTIDMQLKHSLSSIKEASLDKLITERHGGPGGMGPPPPNSKHPPHCDLDHTVITPDMQRAHLTSAYLFVVGDAMGMDGVTAAASDRFLSDALANVHSAHNLHPPQHSRFSHSDTDSVHPSLSLRIQKSLVQSMSVKEWISALLSDINNQKDDADRMIDRAKIFHWASSQGDFKHRVFYDEDRADEFQDLDPSQPLEKNQYEPFLSPLVLVDLLISEGMLERIPDEEMQDSLHDEDHKHGHGEEKKDEFASRMMMGP